MAEVKMLKLGGHNVVCRIENRLSNFKTKAGVPLQMSTIREKWNKQGISIPLEAMNSTLQLAVGSDVHREIMLSVDIPVSMVYNSATMFNIAEQLSEWSTHELKASRFISVNVIFYDKDGKEIHSF